MLGAWLLQRGHRRAVAASFVATSLVFCVTLFGFGSTRVGQHQQNHVLLNSIVEHSTTPQVASFGCLEPSWVFYGRRPIHQIGGVEQTAEFLNASADHFVITTNRHAEQLQLYLSENIMVLTDVPYFLKKDRLLGGAWPGRPCAVRRFHGVALGEAGCAPCARPGPAPGRR